MICWTICCEKAAERHDRCHRSAPVAFRGIPSEEAAREAARAEGWTFEDGEDLCPFHAAVAFAEREIHAGEL